MTDETKTPGELARERDERLGPFPALPVSDDDRAAMAQAIGEANGGAVGLGQLVNAFGAVGAARFDLGPAEELTDEGTRAVLDALVGVAKRRGWGGA